MMSRCCSKVCDAVNKIQSKKVPESHHAKCAKSQMRQELFSRVKCQLLQCKDAFRRYMLSGQDCLRVNDSKSGRPHLGVPKALATCRWLACCFAPAAKPSPVSVQPQAASHPASHPRTIMLLSQWGIQSTESTWHDAMSLALGMAQDLHETIFSSVSQQSRSVRSVAHIRQWHQPTLQCKSPAQFWQC